MFRWKLIGIIATIVIILSFPLYLLKMKYIATLAGDLSEEGQATFVGSLKCRDCHRKAFDQWQNSHHDLAMDVADDKTVLGDFDNAVFESHGVTSRFYRREGKFFVYTQGPDGDMGEHEITHTFGWTPLQQYLVPFPGGRFQCLPIAWDTEKKEWYDLNPDEPVDPGDWLYWTNAGQNWNGMCAECHSTNLKKNYDIHSDTYETTWSDIDVGCEACHGPGSRHLAWAEMPDMARPRLENYALMVKTSGLGSRALVELCAPCHSRRAALGDYTHAEPDLLDSLLPSLLTEALYFPDGQILDEVYVYGSFTQSRMYHRDVRCSDCHDVHSVKLHKKGNELCLQCHRAGEYDTKAHHFHKKKGEEGKPILSATGEVLFEVGTGSDCVQCHMPGRVYMGIDYRVDHSLRNPRPDLSPAMGTPNACNRCHIDKTDKWSDDFITKWYGPGRRPHYGNVLEAGRKASPHAHEDLVKLAGDPLYPVIVRATALSLLTAYPGEKTVQAFETALMDDEALIRWTALNNIYLPDRTEQVERLIPLLYDPVLAVRMEAAYRLTEEPARQLTAEEKKVFQSALDEFERSMQYSGDFASGRYNLGNLYVALDRPEQAIRNYRAAIKIDDLFYPAKVNLAMLHNARGDQDQAEILLREVVAMHPEEYQVAYSLGLLLAEKEQYDEAAQFLNSAAKGLPGHPRVHYNLGLVLQRLQRDPEAETALMKARELAPENLDCLNALADYYFKRGKFREAKKLAEEMIAAHPDNPIGYDWMKMIERE